MYLSMPASVLEYVDVDYRVPIIELAGLLVRLVNDPVREASNLSPEEENLLSAEITIAAQENTFEKVEENIWKSICSLEETIMLLEEVGRNYRDNGHNEVADVFFAKARITREHARKLHAFVFEQKQYSEVFRNQMPEDA